MPVAMIGERISSPEGETFAIADFLGKGAFGEIYRAVGESTGAVVAVKFLPLGALSDDESKRALLNEIRSAQQINHPNVVRVIYIDEGSIPRLGPYVYMDYVSGGNLARVLRAQNDSGTQIPLGRVFEMMLAIAQGAR